MRSKSHVWRAVIFVVLAPFASAQNPIVRTESGLISGEPGDVEVFRGIPYAAPPLSDLRWKAPQPAPRWQGVRKSVAFGAPCPQPAVLKIPTSSEDCLTLNVWTPAHRSGHKLPVMVSIHGGGFAGGWAGLPLYDGAVVARRDIVFVSMNYRLGILGFFAHPELSTESAWHASGNYGLLDQMAALRWVQRNVAEFGGDPKRVTIRGESAGGSAVALLLASPLTKGLFQKAIAQSPQGLYLPMASRGPSETAGARVGARIADLRALSVEQLLKRLAADPTLMKNAEYQPIIEGRLLPEDPARLFESGRAPKIPVIGGTDTDDGFSLVAFSPVRTTAEYHALLNQRFGQQSTKALELYPAETDAEAGLAARRLLSDANFLYGTRAMLLALARSGNPVYWYSFSRVDDLSRKMHSPGALHSTELRYVFGDLSRSLFAQSPLESLGPPSSDDIDVKIAAAMNGAWTTFTKTGSPNSDGLPVWPQVRADQPRYLEYGDVIKVGDGPDTERLKFLADFYLRKTRQELEKKLGKASVVFQRL